MTDGLRGALRRTWEAGDRRFRPAFVWQRGAARGCLGVLADGDPRSAARLLAMGVADLVQLLDVEHIVLGGRTVHATPGLYLRKVAAGPAERFSDPDWRHSPVQLARAGPAGMAIGAVELVRAALFGRRPKAWP